MNKRRFQGAVLLTFTMLLLPVGGFTLWLWGQQRQYALNRQLIAALVHGDGKQALALVNKGADPNTQLVPTPVPSLLELVKQLFHRSEPPDNDSPSAWLIANGANWDDGSDQWQETPIPDAPQLVLAMLRHGANIEAQDQWGATALLSAISSGRLKSVVILVQHNANINATGDRLGTPLTRAMQPPEPDPGTIRLLLQHGADPNGVDKHGSPVLLLAVQYYADIDTIRQLIAYGAKADLGDTIPLAQQHDRPDIVALLKQTGARK